jgi:alpha-galactosidase
MDRVMEEFLRRHPDVWVEMCASGGRMINLGVLRYAHSLWITDYVGGDPDVAADIRGGANQILPAACVHQSLYLPREVMAGEAPLPLRNCLAHFAGIFGISQNVLNWPEQARALIRQWAEHYKTLRRFLAGDFYRLTPRPQSRDAWEGWQFHDAETGSGFALLMRLSESTRTTGKVTLRGMAANARLRIGIMVGTAQVDVDGTELSVSFRDMGCLLLRYESA